MVANPVLLFQRRALSPTVKSLLRLMLAGQSHANLTE
jgi:hypothetical protein